MNRASWQVPANVVVGVKRQWPDIGPRWAERVAGELDDLCERHELILSNVFPARYAFAVAATSQAGEQLVLRSTPDPTARHQAAVAQALADLDVGPRVHDVITTDSATWIITDRVVPGDQLASLPKNRDTFRALARVFQRLVDQPSTRPDLPRLTDWLRRRLLDDHLEDVAPNRQPATFAERAQGLEVLAALEKDHVTSGLCHGDMSSANILLDRVGRLVLIDPRGLSGDATYDASVLTAKAVGYGLSAKVIRQIAKNAGFDTTRIEAWTSVVIAARV